MVYEETETPPSISRSVRAFSGRQHGKKVGEVGFWLAALYLISRVLTLFGKHVYGLICQLAGLGELR
jgi:hypothetical protein